MYIQPWDQSTETSDYLGKDFWPKTEHEHHKQHRMHVSFVVRNRYWSHQASLLATCLSHVQVKHHREEKVLQASHLIGERHLLH
mmetsp:Transcript_2370/g.3782  ORF Transcript_2370/g.3782 Transcript_2370/m.3782 type:complete len:84 (-) Transcript_2370:793-1044(-)